MKFKYGMSYFYVFLIIISIGHIVSEKGVTYMGLIAGSILCIVTLLLAYSEGYIGTLLACFLNFTGLLVSIINYRTFNLIENLLLASFQLGIGIACLIIGRLSIKQDINKKKLQEVAKIDTTTNTFTMNYFNELYCDLIDHSDETIRLSFIIIDLDDFNIINRKFGYSVSESILKSMSAVVREIICDSATIYRVGISELLVLYQDNVSIDLVNEGEAIRQSVIDNRTLFGDKDFASRLSVSIGIGSYPDTTEDIKDLLNDTYAALRYSKNRGKNNVKVYTSVFRDIEDLVNNNRELEIAIKMILLTIKHKDRYTYEHSIRVADYVYEFALKLQVEKFVAEKYKITALVHDVGKINIPMAVLNKEKKLTEAEYTLVKKHTRLGSDIISYLPTVSNYGNVVLFHHERYDGFGYPEGLVGDHIPFGARLIAIVDAFDAMVSKRPYQNTMSIEEAILELEHCSGSQFDPKLVQVFIELVQEKMAVNPTETFNVTINYPTSAKVVFEELTPRQMEKTCEFHPNCPIYSGKLKLKEGVEEIYVNSYCEADYHSCARYIVAKNLGRDYVSTFLMPNMSEKAQRIINQQNETITSK